MSDLSFRSSIATTLRFLKNASKSFREQHSASVVVPMAALIVIFLADGKSDSSLAISELFASKCSATVFMIGF